MSAAQLLNRLRALGATVTARAGELVVRAPPGVLPSTLRAALRAEKPAVLAALGARWCPGHGCIPHAGCALCGARSVASRCYCDGGPEHATGCPCSLRDRQDDR